MKPRKLLTRKALASLHHKTTEGVPLARALRQLNINVTLPTATKLLTHYASLHSDIVSASLFPDWLDEDGPALQEQPSTAKYDGYFPLGEWV